ncbi:MAG: regulatory iron-sulfur-containing complex subunit RicT [bacterium]
MKVAKIQFAPWDKPYYFSTNGFDLEMGEKVIVKTEMGTEIGEIIGFRDVKNEKELFNKSEDKKELAQPDVAVIDDSEASCAGCENGECHNHNKSEERVLKPIIRKALPSDLEKMATESEKREAVKYCQDLKGKYGLPMKIIDVYFSYDGSRITFAFIADGRVDFRELVKDITRHFGRTIRLQQIGIRDEAKIMGDYGHCGRPLCCKKHLSQLVSITSEMADLQQCSHRGSDRISGACGRLMCCLAYEEDGYEQLAKKMPKPGDMVNVDGKRGRTISCNVLKQSVRVAFPSEKGESETIAEVDLNRKNK